MMMTQSFIKSSAASCKEKYLILKIVSKVKWRNTKSVKGDWKQKTKKYTRQNYKHGK